MPYRVRPSCCAAACVLRLSVAKRNASTLKASSYLRRLSGVVLLFFAVMTQETYVLLLCAQPRPPQGESKAVADFNQALHSLHAKTLRMKDTLETASKSVTAAAIVAALRDGVQATAVVVEPGPLFPQQ